MKAEMKATRLAADTHSRVKYPVFLLLAVLLEWRTLLSIRIFKVNRGNKITTANRTAVEPI